MGSSHVSLAPNTQNRLVGGISIINLNTFPCVYGDRYRLVENSHTLYFMNHSIIFLITIHTVTHHSKPQSLHLLCLCLLFHISLSYLVVSFSIFFTSHTVPFYYFIFLYTIFQISYSPSTSFSFFYI